MGNSAAWTVSLSILLAALPAQGLAAPRPAPMQAVADSAVVATARQDWRRQVQTTGATSTQALYARFLIVQALMQDGRHIEAETEARAIEAVVRPMAGAKALATLQIQGLIIEILMNQGPARWAETEAYALPIYRVALMNFGPDAEVTDKPRIALAGIYGNLDRNAEAAPLAQASFDYYRQHGQPENAAAIAGALAVIYRKLGQDERAVQTLLLAPSGGAEELRNLIDRSTDPVIRLRAARQMIATTEPGSDLRGAAEGRLVSILMPLSRAGDVAARVEALTLARRMLAETIAAGDPLVTANVEGAIARLLSGGPSEGRPEADFREAVDLGNSAYARTQKALGDDDHRTIAARMNATLYQAIHALAFPHDGALDAALAELNRAEAFITAHPGAISDEDAGSMAIARAGVQARMEDEGGAYRSIAIASARFQTVAEARASIGRDRNYMAEWSDLTRTQVRRAWDYAETLAPAVALDEDDAVPTSSGPVG